MTACTDVTRQTPVARVSNKKYLEPHYTIAVIVWARSASYRRITR